MSQSNNSRSVRQIRPWLAAAAMLGIALLFRDLLISSTISTAFSEAVLPGTLQALPAGSTRPGGWLVSGAREPMVHPHDFEGITVTPTYSFERIFPQLGNGRIEPSGESFRTRIQAANFSNQPARCRLSFFDDEGAPLAVPVGADSVTSIEFDLGIRELREFVTSGEGEILVGWALLESDQPVAGSLLFGLRDAQDRLVTEVGVPAADPGADLTILADSLGETRTGMAVANPRPEPLQLSVDLLDVEGRPMASQPIDLPANGHRAIFLQQLFSEVAGIEEFLGSVRLRSSAGARFAVLTLRSTRGLLTSLPTVAPPADNSRSRLAFPHVADGVQGELAITTALVVFNNTDTAAGLTLDFFRSDSDPMEVEIAGVRGSSFDHQLPPRGVLKVETRGLGELQSGWARVRMDQPLSGAGIFRIFGLPDAAARESTAAADERTLHTEVGVTTSPLYRNFRILANTGDIFNTGLALANPDEEGLRAGLSIILHSAEGVVLEQRELELPAGLQQALFVNQLFPDRDFGEFKGYLTILTKGRPGVATLALRSAGSKLTSTPTLTPGHGFAPEIEMTPLQNLAGTQPGFSWVLHQNLDDLALQELTIRLDGMTLADELELESGDEIGSGYFVSDLESRTYALLVRESEADRVVFDTVVADSDGGILGGVGHLAEADDQLEIRWALNNPRPFTRLIGDVDHHFFLFPGILQSPPEAGNVNAETDLISVSSRPDEEISALRRKTQSFEFVEGAPDKGNIEFVSPLFVLPAAPMQFAGRNLGDAPTVIFPLQNGKDSRVRAYRNGDGILEAFAPAGVVSGPIFADTGTGPGNAYQIQTLFSPLAELSIESLESDPAGADQDRELVIMIRQQPGELALSHFDLELFDTQLEVEQLELGLLIGTGSFREGNFTAIPLELEVASVVADQATIEVRRMTPQQIKIGELVLRQTQPFEEAVLRFEYRPMEISLGTVIRSVLSPLELELRLQALPLNLPESLVVARFDLVSTPTLAGLAESALGVRVFTPALIPE